jgi:hypothetical protein
MSGLYPKSSQNVNPSDSVSILRTLPEPNRKVATKTWRNGSNGPEREDFGNAYWFQHERRDCSNIKELSAILAELEADPYALIVRAEILEGVNPDKMNRRHLDGGPSKPAMMKPQPRPWLCIDFDNIPAPPLTDLTTDPESAVEYLIGLLPDQFHDAACHWQLSSSAGMSETLSAHCWFWLDRPIADDDAGKWAKHVNETRKAEAAREGRIVGNLVDPAVMRTVQAHYTAAPIFDGLPDPLPRRSGFRDGLTDAVKLTLAPAKTKADGTGFYAKLKLLGDGLGREGFNSPLSRAAASYVASNGIPGPKERETLKTRLRAAIDAAPKEQGRDVSRYQSDAYLDDAIASAARKYGKGPTMEPSDGPPEASTDATMKLMGNATAYTLMMLLWGRNGHHGKPVYCDRRKLAEMFGWGPNRVTRARQFLEAEGWLKWHSGGEAMILDDGTPTKRPKTYKITLKPAETLLRTVLGPNNCSALGVEGEDIGNRPRLDWAADVKIYGGDVDDG